MVKLKSALFSQEHLAALGTVAVESSNLEELLDIIIDGLLRLKKNQMDIVLEGAMMQRKLELVKDLGRLKLKPKTQTAQITELCQIIGDLNHANQERVTAIHGIWRPADKAQLINKVHGTANAIATKKGRRNQADSKLASDKLLGVAARISEGAQKLGKFSMAHFFQTRVSPSKRHLQPAQG